MEPSDDPAEQERIVMVVILQITCMREYTQVLKKLKGSELVGRTYKPMFPYFSGLKAAPGSDKGAFRVVADGYVTADAGTGVVHQAPFFGEDDYRVCRKFGELHPKMSSSSCIFLQISY